MGHEHTPTITPEVFRRLQIKLVEEATADGVVKKKLILLDPTILVDDEPIEHLTFDVTHERSLGEFYEIVLGPSLIASHTTLEQFLTRVQPTSTEEGHD